jgi:hypothetical protein
MTTETIENEMIDVEEVTASIEDYRLGGEWR